MQTQNSNTIWTAGHALHSNMTVYIGTMVLLDVAEQRVMLLM